MNIAVSILINLTLCVTALTKSSLTIRDETLHAHVSVFAVRLAVHTAFDMRMVAAILKRGVSHFSSQPGPLL